jgi:hypothetical protein
MSFERQRPLPIRYKEVVLDCGYRLDFVVESALIVELKAVAELMPIHEAQLLTYLKLDQKPLGLLINFNVAVLKSGVKRVACGDYSGRTQVDLGSHCVCSLLSVPPCLCGSNRGICSPQRHSGESGSVRPKTPLCIQELLRDFEQLSVLRLE